MSVKIQDTAVEVKEKDTRSVQVELYTCEDILSFISETLERIGEHAYKESNREMGARLQAIGRILDDVNVRLYRITDSDACTQIEIPA